MKKKTIQIVFIGKLNNFLPIKKRNRHIMVPWTGRRSIKDLVESLCVPHTEVGGIRIAGQWVDFSYIIGDGDEVTVYPAADEGSYSETRASDNPLFNPESQYPPVFICDVHLWKLTRRLRLLGFDTRFNPQWDDAQLAEISQEKHFILLTRDRGLLIRRIVERGLYIHNTDPEEQVKEVLQRLDLYKRIAPFKRCIACGGILEPVEFGSDLFEEKLRPQIPVKVLEWTKVFHYCMNCKKVFWKGSHYEKLIKMIDRYINVNAFGDLEPFRETVPGPPKASG
jgi:uncharacterized protein with PIN domain